MLPAATTIRPRLRGPLAVFVMMLASLAVTAGIAEMRRYGRIDYSQPHRYFSAFAMLHRATCEQSADYQTFQVGVAQRDPWGNRYTFECNPRGFTIVSSDGTRSDQ